MRMDNLLDLELLLNVTMTRLDHEPTANNLFVKINPKEKD